jgi:hypothetical protein
MRALSKAPTATQILAWQEKSLPYCHPATSLETDRACFGVLKFIASRLLNVQVSNSTCLSALANCSSSIVPKYQSTTNRIALLAGKFLLDMGNFLAIGRTEYFKAGLKVEVWPDKGFAIR